ncbi:flagellar motor switch protein FliN [Oligoflexia bacterium]|nr:flagellar motor switch protein FliN [Oligoflexia bacterium]
METDKDAIKPADAAQSVDDPNEIGFLADVTLMVAVELGRTDLTIERLLQLNPGSVIEVEKLSEEPLDIRMNGKLTARGEAVIVNEKFGIRVTQIIAPFGEDSLC